MFKSKLRALHSVVDCFRSAVKFAQAPGKPYSCYLPVVQATENSFIDSCFLFEDVFGVEAAEELRGTVNPRFNFDGGSTLSRKVGFIDDHAVWAYLMDPFLGEAGAPIVPSAIGFAYRIAKDMADFFFEDPGDRRKCVAEFSEFYLGTGRWNFKEASPKDYEGDAELSVTLESVGKWAEDTGGFISRITFFEMPTNGKSYIKEVGMRLFSVHMVASMAVESGKPPFKFFLKNARLYLPTPDSPPPNLLRQASKSSRRTPGGQPGPNSGSKRRQGFARRG